MCHTVQAQHLLCPLPNNRDSRTVIHTHPHAHTWTQTHTVEQYDKLFPYGPQACQPSWRRKIRGQLEILDIVFTAYVSWQFIEIWYAIYAFWKEWKGKWKQMKCLWYFSGLFFEDKGVTLYCDIILTIGNFATTCQLTLNLVLVDWLLMLYNVGIFSVSDVTSADQCLNIWCLWLRFIQSHHLISFIL